jgi:hypothetical protein
MKELTYEEFDKELEKLKKRAKKINAQSSRWTIIVMSRIKYKSK